MNLAYKELGHSGEPLQSALIVVSDVKLGEGVDSDIDSLAERLRRKVDFVSLISAGEEAIRVTCSISEVMCGQLGFRVFRREVVRDIRSGTLQSVISLYKKRMGKGQVIVWYNGLKFIIDKILNDRLVF